MDDLDFRALAVLLLALWYPTADADPRHGRAYEALRWYEALHPGIDNVGLCRAIVRRDPDMARVVCAVLN